MANREFTTINIADCMDNKIEGFGEADLKRALATFSSIDPHVEAFLKNSAEDFARQHKSVTYLVLPADMTELLGYFTLAAKPITLELGKMSKTMERAVKKTGKLDVGLATYTTSAFLVAQLGKNFSPSLKNSISGSDLLDGALYILKGIQRGIGGTIAFLEAQGSERLLPFCGSNGFREFDRRTASYKDGGSFELVQLFKVLQGDRFAPLGSGDLSLQEAAANKLSAASSTRINLFL